MIEQPDSEVLGELCVRVDVEAELPRIEVLRPVDIGDGNDDHLERHFHAQFLASADGSGTSNGPSFGVPIRSALPNGSRIAQSVP